MKKTLRPRAADRRSKYRAARARASNAPPPQELAHQVDGPVLWPSAPVVLTSLAGRPVPRRRRAAFFFSRLPSGVCRFQRTRKQGRVTRAVRGCRCGVGEHPRCLWCVWGRGAGARVLRPRKKKTAQNGGGSRCKRGAQSSADRRPPLPLSRCARLALPPSLFPHLTVSNTKTQRQCTPPRPSPGRPPPPPASSARAWVSLNRRGARRDTAKKPRPFSFFALLRWPLTLSPLFSPLSSPSSQPAAPPPCAGRPPSPPARRARTRYDREWEEDGARVGSEKEEAEILAFVRRWVLSFLERHGPVASAPRTPLRHIVTHGGTPLHPLVWWVGWVGWKGLSAARHLLPRCRLRPHAPLR